MDWVAFLEASNVPYVTAGPNTKRGNISIACPFCGDDPSEHLSIALHKDAYGCWRDGRHAGRKPYPLIAALLHCSFSQAKLIERQFSTADPETFEDAVMALGGTIMPADKPKPPQGLPPSFQPIKPNGRFWRYLQRRGFDDVQSLIGRYGLCCAQTSEMKDRVILPIHSEGHLIGWVGRAIQKTTTAPRYLTSSAAVKAVLFNEDKLIGGKRLFITEGPFDALKVDFYGYPRIQATCLFGVNPTVSQIGMLRQVAKGYSRVGIMFDAEATEQAMELQEYLSHTEIVSLPRGVKDPGELTKQQVMDYAG